MRKFGLHLLRRFPQVAWQVCVLIVGCETSAAEHKSKRFEVPFTQLCAKVWSVRSGGGLIPVVYRKKARIALILGADCTGDIAGGGGKNWTKPAPCEMGKATGDI
ncbi:hypothetical protein MED193_09815 [Roseobacter sp. MED193]|nr:hypothetical protein MED193_09815 [Roseobacter sp. MED193]